MRLWITIYIVALLYQFPYYTNSLIALFIFSLEWLLKLSLLSKIIPRCLCKLVGVKILSLNLRVGSWISDRFLEKTISVACFQASGLKDIFQEYAHLDIKYRSSLSYRRTNTILHYWKYWCINSKKYMFDCIPSGISLIKIRKERGPNIEPWGTPATIFVQFEVWPLSTTLWNLFVKKPLLELRVDHLYHMIWVYTISLHATLYQKI